jgi:hypothetical protein
MMLPSFAATIQPLEPSPRSLAHLGIGPYPLQETLEAALARPAPAGWQPTGLDRVYYLDAMAAILAVARGWQNADGAIIDPVAGRECGQTSPRFAAPGAILLAFGRMPELAEPVARAMDWSCQLLASGAAPSPDFWMRELATAYLCLAPFAEPERLARWAADLRAVVPERVYTQVDPAGTRLAELHNWTVYAAAGEVLRARAGLAPDEDVCWGDAFFAKYLAAQCGHFTACGMYRDPHDPITYDITTRLQIATALAVGGGGVLRDDLSELLRRGALTHLLFCSAEGYVPFGGRSSQFHFQEAIIAALCELEARRYAAAHPALAGAFKRQAHLSARAVARWLSLSPPRHLKNGFPPEASFGIDPYGEYSVYLLLAASFFGLAALFADDTIAEAPCPAEVGGYAVALAPAFHKVFATVGDTQVEIDTRGQAGHDATGLGRFCRTGVPIELGLSMPITAAPSYRLPEAYRSPVNLAIGPAWRCGDTWHRLAEYTEGPDAKVHADAAPEAVAVTMTYATPAGEVTEAYRLREGVLDYRVVVAGEEIEAIRLLVPLLVSDGEAESAIQVCDGVATVSYRGATLAVRYAAGLSATLDDATVANRNGLYRCLVLECPGTTISATLALTPQENAGAGAKDQERRSNR